MIIAFDLNGTLTDLRPLTGDDRALVAFDQALVLAMAETLSGDVKPFPEYLRAALERAAPELADAAMKRLPSLPAQPDAAEALTLLRDVGHRVVVVTNSATVAGWASLRGAGLDGLVETVVGTDEVGAYKPDPRVYANAARVLGAEPTDLWLVAAHAWDVQGAVRAGWRGAWVGHREGTLAATVREDRLATGPTLLDVARSLT